MTKCNAYLMMHFHVLACRAISRLEITEHMSSRLCITDKKIETVEKLKGNEILFPLFIQSEDVTCKNSQNATETLFHPPVTMSETSSSEALVSTETLSSSSIKPFWRE